MYTLATRHHHQAGMSYLFRSAAPGEARLAGAAADVECGCGSWMALALELWQSAFTK